jgi:uncharacterized RDD family membrane protein YckC
MRRLELEGQYAGFASRAVAWVIDLVVISTVVFLGIWLISTSFSFAGIDLQSCPTSAATFFSLAMLVACRVAAVAVWVFSIGFAPLYLFSLWMLGGQTIGKRIAGVRVVRWDGTQLLPRHALLRVVGYAVCLITLGIGFLWVLVDDRRRGLHDRIAHTSVVYVRGDYLRTWFTDGEA